MKRTVYFDSCDDDFMRDLIKGFMSSSDNWREMSDSHLVIGNRPPIYDASVTKAARFRQFRFVNGCKTPEPNICRKTKQSLIEDYADHENIFMFLSSFDTFYAKDVIDHDGQIIVSKTLFENMKEMNALSENPFELGYQLGVYIGALLDAEPEVES